MVILINLNFKGASLEIFQNEAGGKIVPLSPSPASVQPEYN